MMSMIREYGQEPVMITVIGAVTKCAESLNITMSPQQLQTIAEDILEVYRYDSIEDVIECLKKGRRGLYGFGHNSRSSLNMILIGEWMSKHLEEKASVREKELSKYKSMDKEPLTAVDYEAYKKRVQDKPEKENNATENEYHRFRLKYLDELAKDKESNKIIK